MTGHSVKTVFTQLRRYARLPRRDAREDRLTEAFAVTLNAAPEAGRFLVESFFDRAAPDNASVTASTQVPVRFRRRVDLELCFGRRDRPELLVWFENKVDAPAYREQGEHYVDELEREDCSWEFAWLTRLGADVDRGLPDGTDHFSWQRVAQALQDWLNGQSARRPRDVGPWFVRQFLDHLEREEGLAYTKPFQIDDAKAIYGAEDATQKLHVLMSSAAALVRQRWGTFEERDIERLGPYWATSDSEHWYKDEVWFNYPTASKSNTSAFPDTWWFELSLVQDAGRSGRESDGLIVTAGLALRGADRDDSFDALAEKLQDEGFISARVGDEEPDVWDCLFRSLDLEQLADLIGDRDFESQADAFAGWVADAFVELDRARQMAES